MDLCFYCKRKAYCIHYKTWGSVNFPDGKCREFNPNTEFFKLPDDVREWVYRINMGKVNVCEFCRKKSRCRDFLKFGGFESCHKFFPNTKFRKLPKFVQEWIILEKKHLQNLIEEINKLF